MSTKKIWILLGIALFYLFCAFDRAEAKQAFEIYRPIRETKSNRKSPVLNDSRKNQIRINDYTVRGMAISLRPHAIRGLIGRLIH